ncbi:MAG TPA: hypothetical protein DCP69_06005 [Candidatus Omnitrophica bacterium]|nr:hypothetical protein [Candidatus Omnitrophota bacterium]
MPHGGSRIYGGQPRFGHVARDGRPQISFQGRTYRVHRLICEAFHGPKPFPDAVVLHEDENPTNNKKTNVKWGTQRENLHAPGFLAYCHTRTGLSSPRVKGRLMGGSY